MNKMFRTIFIMEPRWPRKKYIGNSIHPTINIQTKTRSKHSTQQPLSAWIFLHLFASVLRKQNSGKKNSPCFVCRTCRVNVLFANPRTLVYTYIPMLYIKYNIQALASVTIMIYFYPQNV